MKFLLLSVLSLASLNTYSMIESEQSLIDQRLAAERVYSNIKIQSQSLPPEEQRVVLERAQEQLAKTNAEIEASRKAGPPSPLPALEVVSNIQPGAAAPGLSAPKISLRAQRREARSVFRQARRAAKSLPPEERDAALVAARAAFQKAIAEINGAAQKAEQNAIAAANSVNNVLEQNAQQNQTSSDAQIASLQVVEQIPVAAADDPSKPKLDVPGSRPPTDSGRGGGGGGSRGSQVSAQ